MDSLLCSSPCRKQNNGNIRERVTSFICGSSVIQVERQKEEAAIDKRRRVAMMLFVLFPAASCGGGTESEGNSTKHYQFIRSTVFKIAK